jgi:FMN phosphatase YigB (HAD superfamily)
VTNELKVKSEEILYWDDSESHIESAQAFGIRSYLYKDFEEFRKQISRLLGV